MRFHDISSHTNMDAMEIDGIIMRLSLHLNEENEKTIVAAVIGPSLDLSLASLWSQET